MARAWSLRVVALVAMLAGAALLLRQPPRQDWTDRVESPGRLRIITTILPIHSLARSVVGSDGDVRNLLPPGADVHDVSLAPSDVSMCAGADLVFLNGAGLDDFIRGALRRANVPDSRLVVVSHGLPGSDEAEHDDNHAHGHAHGVGVDPHYWLNPVYARTYVRHIADAVARRSTHPEAVRARAAALDDRIARLDREFEDALSQLRGRAVLSHHAAYSHLAHRYGLRIAGVWQVSPGRDPTPTEVAALLRTARREDVAALMVEPQFSSRSIRLVAGDAGLRVVRIDPMETAADPDTADYVETMRGNLMALRDALR